MQTFSDNLKAMRLKYNLSPQEVAEAIGIKYKTYHAWENRNIEPALEMLITIAAFYNLTVDELINANAAEKSNADKLSMRFATAPQNIRKAIINILNL